MPSIIVNTYMYQLNPTQSALQASFYYALILPAEDTDVWRLNNSANKWQSQHPGIGIGLQTALKPCTVSTASLLRSGLHPHFMDEAMEARCGRAAFSASQSWRAADLGFNSGF